MGFVMRDTLLSGLWGQRSFSLTGALILVRLSHRSNAVGTTEWNWRLVWHLFSLDVGLVGLIRPTCVLVHFEPETSLQFSTNKSLALLELYSLLWFLNSLWDDSGIESLMLPCGFRFVSGQSVFSHRTFSQDKDMISQYCATKYIMELALKMLCDTCHCVFLVWDRVYWTWRTAEAESWRY